jgi:hypothetical protein
MLNIWTLSHLIKIWVFYYFSNYVYSVNLFHRTPVMNILSIQYVLIFIYFFLGFINSQDWFRLLSIFYFITLNISMCNGISNGHLSLGSSVSPFNLADRRFESPRKYFLYFLLTLFLFHFLCAFYYCFIFITTIHVCSVIYPSLFYIYYFCS